MLVLYYSGILLCPFSITELPDLGEYISIVHFQKVRKYVGKHLLTLVEAFVVAVA